VERYDIAFMGKITAGMTHEMRNVLAIIRESGGLIQDLLALNRENFPHRDKVDRALANIQDQVGRGIEIGARLSRFAHSVDEPLGTTDLFDLLGSMEYLLQRFARLKRVKLKAINAGDNPTVHTDLLALQYVIATAVEHVLDQSSEGQTVGLIPRRTLQGPGIQIMAVTGDNPPDPGPEATGPLPGNLNGVSELLEVLKARLSIVETDGNQGVMIVLDTNLRESDRR
jgi:phosphoglycerate-specific signal transduction histidine kinase